MLSLLTFAIHPTNKIVVDRAIGPAHYAAAAYCMSRTSKVWNCAIHCTAPETAGTIVYSNIQSSETGAFVAITYQPDLNITTVAFKGTTNPGDFIADSKFAITTLTGFSGIQQSNNIQVDSGFLQQYLSVQTQVLDDLKEMVYKFPENRIHFVGHSLGGATSQLGALDASTSLGIKDRVEVFAFSAPRLGNEGFVNLLNFPINRFTHSFDIVSRIPPTFLGYTHPNQSEYWEKESNVFYTCNEQESDDCTNSNSLPSTDILGIHLTFATVIFGPVC